MAASGRGCGLGAWLVAATVTGKTSHWESRPARITRRARSTASLRRDVAKCHGLCLERKRAGPTGCGRRLPGGLRGPRPVAPVVRRQEPSKFGQACCEQSLPTGRMSSRSALASGWGCAGFDLGGKAGQNGECGGNEGGNGDGRKCPDHDGPLSWSLWRPRFVGRLVPSASFRRSSPPTEMVSSRREFCFVVWLAHETKSVRPEDALGASLVHSAGAK